MSLKLNILALRIIFQYNILHYKPHYTTSYHHLIMSPQNMGHSPVSTSDCQSNVNIQHLNNIYLTREVIKNKFLFTMVA